jgi:hypothetical protein
LAQSRPLRKRAFSLDGGPEIGETDDCPDHQFLPVSAGSATRLLGGFLRFWVSCISRRLTNRYGANRRITGQFASSSDSRRENHDRRLKALPVTRNFDAKVTQMPHGDGRRQPANRFYGKIPALNRRASETEVGVLHIPCVSAARCQHPCLRPRPSAASTAGQCRFALEAAGCAAWSTNQRSLAQAAKRRR